MAQDDDFQEEKRFKKHNLNSTWQMAKESNKQAQTTTAVKLPPKAVLMCNLFSALRTTTELRTTDTTCTENTVPEEAPRKSSGWPPNNDFNHKCHSTPKLHKIPQRMV
jgi:hypothetical protein